mmetsp:Transcript_29085/g.74674  ORF Transcript_29085/g.74674 Transcript_29085/m.74674 type:complete len:347 (-) Transcript_29085:131-1171(-)
MVGAALPYNMTEKELVLLTTHGSLMSLNWAFLTVFGVIIARYYRHRTWWATVHKLVQGIASVTTLPVFVIALVSGIHEGLTTIHADIGLSVVILGTLQGVMGTIMWGSISLPFCSKVGCRLPLPKSLKEGGRGRKVLVSIHTIVGKLLVFEAAAVIFLGMLILPTAVFVRYMYVGWVVVWVVTVIVLETRLQLAMRERRRAGTRERQNKDVEGGEIGSSPHSSTRGEMEEIGKEGREGSKSEASVHTTPKLGRDYSGSQSEKVPILSRLRSSIQQIRVGLGQDFGRQYDFGDFGTYDFAGVRSATTEEGGASTTEGKTGRKAALSVRSQPSRTRTSDMERPLLDRQ